MSNKVEATYHPNGHPMPVTREARYLSGADVGKAVEGVDLNGRAFACTATRIDQAERWTDIWSEASPDGLKTRRTLNPTALVTITGTPS